MQRFQRICGALLAAAVLVTMPLSGSAKDADRLKSTDLGSGMKIDLPTDWRLDGMVNIATNLPDLRKLGIKAYEWRADTGTMRIGISYIMFPGSGAQREADLDGTRRKDLLVKGTEQYLPRARETAVDATVFANGSVTGAYATLHAKEGDGFPVFMGRSYKCVTVANAFRGDGLLSISVGSADCDSAEHRTAVAAIVALHE